MLRKKTEKEKLQEPTLQNVLKEIETELLKLRDLITDKGENYPLGSEEYFIRVLLNNIEVVLITENKLKSLIQPNNVKPLETKLLKAINDLKNRLESRGQKDTTYTKHILRYTDDCLMVLYEFPGYSPVEKYRPAFREIEAVLSAFSEKRKPNKFDCQKLSLALQIFFEEPKAVFNSVAAQLQLLKEIAARADLELGELQFLIHRSTLLGGKRKKALQASIYQKMLRILGQEQALFIS